MSTGSTPLPANIINLRGISGRNSAAGRAARDTDSGKVPIPKSTHPKAPDKLTAQGKMVFNELAGTLHGMMIMTDADVHALCMYVDSYLIYEACMEVIRKDGATDENGMQRQEIVVARHSHKECLRLLAEFGLTPSSRVRVRSSG